MQFSSGPVYKSPVGCHRQLGTVLTCRMWGCKPWDSGNPTVTPRNAEAVSCVPREASRLSARKCGFASFLPCNSEDRSLSAPQFAYL